MKHLLLINPFKDSRNIYCHTSSRLHTGCYKILRKSAPHTANMWSEHLLRSGNWASMRRADCTLLTLIYYCSQKPEPTCISSCRRGLSGQNGLFPDWGREGRKGNGGGGWDDMKNAGDEQVNLEFEQWDIKRYVFNLNRLSLFLHNTGFPRQWGINSLLPATLGYRPPQLCYYIYCRIL